MKKEHKDTLPEYKPIKTRGAMYVLSPFIFYVIGVIIVELLLSLAFFLFSLAASSLGNSLFLSVDAFLYRNEEMLIPAISGIIKIPHFLKDFYARTDAVGAAGFRQIAPDIFAHLLEFYLLLFIFLFKCFHTFFFLS